MLIDPTSLTVGDMLSQALREANALGVGQSPLAQDIQEAQFRLQLMLQEWERESFLVYHKVTYGVVATGQKSYSVGPGGEINTSQTTAWALLTSSVVSAGSGYAIGDIVGFTGGISIQITKVSPLAFNVINAGSLSNPLPLTLVQSSTSGRGAGLTLGSLTWTLIGTNPTNASVRPAKIYSAFVRQISNPGNPVDYDLRRLESMEDYNRLALKNLSSFPSLFYYDPSWPLGQFMPWPVPQASIYECFVTLLEQLPISWINSASTINLPYEYYAAILYNLAVRLVSKYGRVLMPGDPLVSLAKQSLEVIRPAYAQLAELSMPTVLKRDGIYNIFSDTTY